MYDAWTIIKTLHDERVNQSTKTVGDNRPNLSKLISSVGKRFVSKKAESHQQDDGC